MLYGQQYKTININQCRQSIQLTNVLIKKLKRGQLCQIFINLLLNFKKYAQSQLKFSKSDLKMERTQNLLHELERSISSLKIDFQILERLKIEICSLNIRKENFEECLKLLLQIYDLSNNQKLYTVRKTSISMNQMAVELKVLVCKIMSMIINYFEKQGSVSLIPFQTLSEGIEIMILSTRVCLNEAHSKFISFLQQFYTFIYSPYEYVAESLARNFQFFHHLNSLQLMRFRCQNQSFSVIEFQKRLNIISTFEEFKILDYRGFIQNIVMEILLKSLKNGKISSEDLNLFQLFISEENKKDLELLIFSSYDSVKNLQSSSQFLQIFNQIKNYGIESISFQFLEQFMKQEKNFNDERIFQIAVLTSEVDFLQIWFSIFNSKKQKSSLLDKGLMCYIHIIESIFNQNSSPNIQVLSSILKLSNTIIVTLLTQKKSIYSHQPVLSIIKTLLKVLTFLCFSLDLSWIGIKEFGERLVLICSRYQCMEVSKVIYTVLLYCALVNRQKAEDIYQKFLVYHNTQKLTQVYKLLSTAYQFQNSILQNRSLDEINNLELVKQSFMTILFAKNNEDMTIFDIDMKEFKQIHGKFFIYSEMMKKYKGDETNTEKILNHLESFVIKANSHDFQSYLKEQQQEDTYLQQLFVLLIQKLELKQLNIFHSIQSNINEEEVKVMQKFSRQENKNQIVECRISSSLICFILINLYISANSVINKQLKQTSTCVLLNKYSMKVKIINELIEKVKKQIVSMEIQFYHICCCYLVTMLEKFKKYFLKKERIGQPGEISFVIAIEQLVLAYQSVPQEKDRQNSMDKESSTINVKSQIKLDLGTKQIKVELIEFIIFEIDCIINNYEKYLKNMESFSISLLRIFIHSVYTPKNLKQMILRRLVRQNFMQDGSDITLKQFKEIIEITEDQEELELYIKYVFCTYGEEGRKMLMLIAHENKKLQRILLNESDIEI